jgi:hypothetical protein
MTTCRDVILYALKQAKILAPGSEPEAEEVTDGLVAFQSLLDGWVASGMFGRLNDRYKSADYTAQPGERVTAPAGVTITIPDTVTDCEEGGSRAPRDLALIETIVDGTRTLKIWDRTGWVSLLGLATNDLAPLASRGAWGLAAVLATSGAFAAMFGGEPSADVRQAARAFSLALSYKIGSTQDPTPIEYC